MTDDVITMAHGNGGALMQRLIRDYFVVAFDNPILAQGEDQARIELTELTECGGKLAFSTDSFVIDPVFFPGGDIGKLAVLVELKVLKPGDQYIITSGSQMRKSGATNMLQVMSVE